MNLFHVFLLWIWANAAYAALHIWAGYRREITAFLRHPIRTIWGA